MGDIVSLGEYRESKLIPLEFKILSYLKQELAYDDYLDVLEALADDTLYNQLDPDLQAICHQIRKEQ